MISFESTDTYPWIVMTDEADRVYAMSGNKGVHSSSSTVTATFTLEAPAILSFDYMAWGESSSYSIYDKCIFKLDGTEIFSKGAENNAWDTYTVENTLFAGDHTIEFTFTKDSYANGTGDYFKIDNVKLADASSVTPTPAPTPIPDGEDTYYLAGSIEAGKEYLIVNSDQIGSASALIAADASTIAAGGVAVSSEGSNTIIRSYVTDAYVWTAETKASGAFILKNNGVNKYLDAGYSGLYLWGNATSAYAITYSNSVLKVGSYTVYWNSTAFAASVSGSGNIYLFVKNGATPDPTPEPTPVPEGLIAGYYFESEQELEAWTAIDADNDSYTWQWIYDNSDFQPYEGNGFFGSASWDSSGPLVPNNYAIVGPIQLLDYDNELTFYAAGLGAENCAEHFEVLIGLSADPAEMGVLIEDTVTTADYVQYSADLDDYAGNEVYIAFHHFNCTDMYWLRLDQVEIWGYEREYNTILIEQINVIRMTEPAYGEAPYYEAQPANFEDPYTVSLVEWYCDDEPMQEGDLFDNAEAEYYAIIYLDANEGYVFAEVPEAPVNGSEEYVIEAVPFNENTAFGIIWGTFTVDAPVDDEIINTVEILDFVEPAWGEVPFAGVTVPEGANYTLGEVYWAYFDGENWNAMDEGELFDNEEYSYCLMASFIPNEGYMFAAEIEATINGRTELAGETTVWSDLVNLLSIEFTVTASAPENIWGDANGDGETTIEDALLLMRYMIGLAEVSEDNLEWCDVNGDGNMI